METTSKQQSRPNPDFYYDAAALVTLLGLLITGLVLWPLLGFGPAAPKYFWSLHRQQWINLHLAFALAFGVICLIHLVRHWRWVRLMTPRHLGWGLGPRAIARFLLVILLTGAVVWEGYAIFEKSRMNTVESRSGIIARAARAQNRDEAGARGISTIPESGKSRSQAPGQGRGPRWRGGRNGQGRF